MVLPSLMRPDQPGVPWTDTAVGALAAYAAVCVAVVATVMASRDVTADTAVPSPVTSGCGEPDRLVRRCR